MTPFDPCEPPAARPQRLSRRALLAGCAAALISPVAARAALRQSVDLDHRLREAARTGAAVRLPPGVVALRGLDLPDGATLIGAPGGTTLRSIGQGPLFRAGLARKITLESLILDGGGGHLGRDEALIEFTDVFDYAIHGCVFRNSPGHGVKMLRSGGRFTQSVVERIANAGFHSLDGLGVDFDGNHVRDCGDNGVMIWTTSAGRHEGSRLRNNRIEDIRNVSGGVGAYGNGVSVWGSGGLRVENNTIRRCAYTAVRNNSGHDMIVRGNDCKTFGEKAMYAEFGAKRSTFADNRIDDCGAGIVVTNADSGTDGGVVTGNVVTGMSPRRPDHMFGPEMGWLIGLEGEKNCEISGNTVVGPGWIGVALGGWRDNVRAEDNRLENLDYGIVMATGADAGRAVIARNRITGARKAAIAATAGPTFLPGDLATTGSTDAKVTVRDNEVK